MFMADYYSTACICRLLFIHSSADGLRLFPPFGYCEGCCCEHSFIQGSESLFSVLWGLYLGAKLLGHMIIPYLIF